MPNQGWRTGRDVAPLIVALALADFASPGSAASTAALFDSPYYLIAVTGEDFAIADLDGDGKDDCVSILFKNARRATVGVYMNRGERNFELLPEMSIGDLPENVECVELDGDGLPDLVVTGPFGVKTLFGDGTGHFRNETTLIDGPARLSTGDLNGDRITDLVIQQNNHCLVFLARRGGGFDNTYDLTTARGIPVLGDFDQDGAQDVVVIPTGPFQSGARVVLFPGDGLGGFGLQRASETSVDATAVEAVVCHITSDAFPDIVLRYGSALGMLRSRGNRTFVFSWGVACRGQEPGAKTIAEPDADAHTERFSVDADLQSGGIRSIGATDVDGDGRIEFLYSYILGGVDIHSTIRFSDGRCINVDETGPTGITTGDLDGDGRLDLVGRGFYCLVVHPGDGAGGFGRGYRTKTPQSRGGVVADFDGDGLLDVGLNLGSSVAISRGSRNGSFGPVSGAGQEIPFNYRFIAANVDNDGMADLVTDRGKVWLGKGDGTFHEVSALRDPGRLAYVASADLNSDGRMDLVFSGEPTMAYLGHGDGTFEPSWTTAIVGGPCLIADGDGDGRPDLFVKDWFARGIGDGTFAEPTLIGSRWVAAAGDLSGDRVPDLVTDGGEILRGLGNGRWSAWTALPSVFPWGGGPPFSLGDFDGDGDLDIAADDSQQHAVGVYLNDSQGGFSFAGEYGAGLFIYDFQALEGADVTGDGKLDLIAIAPGYPYGIAGVITTLVNVYNRPPKVAAATARLESGRVNGHGFASAVVEGIVDPEGDAFTVEVVGVEQDEPVLGSGSGNTCPDATIQNGRAAVRMERSGHGNGRVYEIHFIARDALGNESEGRAQVCVPHDNSGKKPCIDDGRRYSSLACRGDQVAETDDEPIPTTAELRVLSATAGDVRFGVRMPGEGAGDVTVFDLTGRRLTKLEFACEGPCERDMVWNRGGSAPGVYFARLRTAWGVTKRTVVLTGR